MRRGTVPAFVEPEENVVCFGILIATRSLIGTGGAIPQLNALCSGSCKRQDEPP